MRLSTLVILLLLMVPAPGVARDPVVRVAVYQSELGRDGPGLLLRDIRRRAADVLAVRDTVLTAQPDVLLLLRFDWDLNGLALAAFQTLLAEGGHPMPHAFAPRPNSGIATGIDLDGDGRTGTPDDAQGFGRFAGAGGMALLSRLPIDGPAARDHSAFLWRDLPGSLMPMRDGLPFPSPEAAAIQRLSSTGHWQVPVRLADGTVLTLMAWHAGPPAFGGPLGRNRRRNHDEARFWWLLLDGDLPLPPPAPPFVLMGNSNLDPVRGDGMHQAMRALLDHPMLQDPRPQAEMPDGAGPDDATVVWPRGPGAMRVSYILPDAGARVAGAGLIRPRPPARHALIWTDLVVPSGPQP